MYTSKDDPNENENGELIVNNPNLEERAAFNDVIKHGDIVQGFQAPKRLEQMPKWYRNPRRIFTTISLLVFFSVLIYQVIDFIIAVAADQ